MTNQIIASAVAVAAGSGYASTPVRVELNSAAESVMVEMLVTKTTTVEGDVNARKVFTLYTAQSLSAIDPASADVKNLLHQSGKRVDATFQPGDTRVVALGELCVKGSYLYLWFETPQCLCAYEVTVTLAQKNNYSSGDAVSVTPSDSTLLTDGVTWGLYVGVTGDVSVLTAEDQTVTFTALAGGIVHPLRVKRVNATSTTATNILAIY